MNPRHAAQILTASALCFCLGRSLDAEPARERASKAEGDAGAVAEALRANTAAVQKLAELIEGRTPRRDVPAETAAAVAKELGPALDAQAELLERLADAIDRLSNRIEALPKNIPGAVSTATAPLGPAGAGPQASRPRFWPRYPIRAASTWWSGCDGWRHLTQGDHAGLFDPNWLASLSNEEIQSLHSDHHEKRVNWDRVLRPSTAPAVAVASTPRPRAAAGPLVVETHRRHRRRERGGCPDGLCPLLRR